ncbi:MAG: hypothetical protein MR033_07915 [Clostridiales bacterium]|nr:hypothetical protein [Clostridiales bacterium]
MAYVDGDAKPKRRLGIERTSIFSTLAAIFMGLAIVLRLVEFWGFWRTDMQDFTFYSQMLLPVLGAALYLLLLVIGGRKALWLSMIPTCMLCLFFIVHAFSFEWWRMVSYILIYLVLAAVYVITVTSRPRMQWLLILLSLLPPAYQIGVETRELWQSGTATASDWVAQLGILCLMLGMLIVSLGMRRVKPAQTAGPVPTPDAPPVFPAEAAAQTNTSAEGAAAEPAQPAPAGGTDADAPAAPQPETEAPQPERPPLVVVEAPPEVACAPGSFDELFSRKP